MSRMLFGMVMIAALATGCTARGHTRGTAYVSASGPDLAYVAPGVYVIADYGEPIFYSDGWYWWHVHGSWYRSQRYTGGWRYVDRPPRPLVRIHDRDRYRHYRPDGYVRRHRPEPADRIERPRPRVRVRDHRR